MDSYVKKIGPTQITYAPLDPPPKELNLRHTLFGGYLRPGPVTLRLSAKWIHSQPVYRLLADKCGRCKGNEGHVFKVNDVLAFGCVHLACWTGLEPQEKKELDLVPEDYPSSDSGRSSTPEPKHPLDPGMELDLYL